MRVLHVNLASGFSGGESQTLQLIKEQQRLGYQLAVVANPKSPFAEHIRQLDIPVHDCRHFLLSHQSAITNGAQLIHVHEGKALYWAMLQSWAYKVPYIITRRIDNPIKNKKLLRLGYRQASAVVGLSQVIADRIKDATDHPNIHIIPSSPVSYPVNSKEVEAIKERFANRFIVIQAGNLLKHKGFDVTIKAAQQLAQEAPNVQLVLLGDGPEMGALKAQAQNLSNVTFAGKQPREMMGNWFNAADLQIHPSYSEGLGSVILEGMQSGLTVIGTRAGGIVDIIKDSDNGFLIEPGDADALAAKISLLAHDDELKTKMQTQARQSMKNFSIEHTAQIYGDLYRHIALL
ncbi:glycosyltransferase family 4 protein [Celerinatantimonas sp. MCCC 1A17872]|uniref:glycosyltransferase family 4 protein n=1 Tax=Celerinatantimonas sp. MCCC 1A17872 TaxID=3177514 RepID=UPI0038BF1CC7